MASIGYKLTKEKGWDVNILPSEAFIETTADNLIREINFFNPETKDALIIIEDFHKNAFDIVYILEHMIHKKSRILLVSRDSFKTGLQQKDLEFLKRFKIKELEKNNFSKIADGLIETYRKKMEGARKKDYEKLNEDHISKFKNLADGNLWILAYLLEAWSPNKIINMEIVYDKIKKDIDDLDKEFKRLKEKLRGVSDSLLALAPFSKYEVGVSESFINENGVIKLNKDTLEKLVDYGEIVDENGLYSIPHSALAELYMETAMHYIDKNGFPSLLVNLFDESKDGVFSGNAKKYSLELLQAYLKSNPRNYGEVVNRVCNYEAGNSQVLNNNLRHVVDRVKEKRNIPLRTLLIERKFPIDL